MVRKHQACAYPSRRAGKGGAQILPDGPRLNFSQLSQLSFGKLQ